VVSVDGHDLRHVTQDSLRAQMGVVFQDAFLFKGSVGDNIRMGKPDATFGEIEHAARAAQIHDLIASWPDGYDTPVGESGGHLSGGQRQRVALARALIRNPGILLLDEATSALDTATEAAFNQTLRQLSLGRTIVQVTHRLAGVVDADRIYVLEDGQVVECGTHPQLLAQRGPYANLWRQQFERSSLSADGRLGQITPARLRTMALFEDMEDKLLERFASRFSTERMPEQQVVCEQGDFADTLYVIAYGRVDVLRREDDGPEELLQVLQEGDVFGESALLNDAPRAATVRTRTPCVFLTLSRQQFRQVLDAEPYVSGPARTLMRGTRV
jgi:ATP-binding cassette subfamily B protein